MQDFEDEDQQLEAFKKWWKENGQSLVIGVVLGASALFGWREYTAYQLEHTQTASDLYNVVAIQSMQNSFTDVNKLEQLKDEFADTPYPVMAAMAVARYYHDKGDVDQAVVELEWARSNTDVEEMMHLASLRLATIHLSREDYDAARALLEVEYPEAFLMRYEELRGDLFLAEGDKEKAKMAYDKAVESESGVSVNPLLNLKRLSLGS